MNKLFFLLIAGILGSCTLSRVDKYPGKPVNAFPEDIQGEYRAKVSGIRGLFYSKQLDSLRIRITDKNIDMLGQDGWETNFSISKDQVLTQLENYYFISSKDAQDPAYWNSSMVSSDGKDLIFFALSAQSNDLAKDPLKNYLPLMLVTKKNGKKDTHKIEGDAALAKASLVKDDSKDSILYYQMSDEQVMRYIKNEMHAKNSFRFIRVKQPIK